MDPSSALSDASSLRERRPSSNIPRLKPFAAFTAINAEGLPSRSGSSASFRADENAVDDQDAWPDTHQPGPAPKDVDIFTPATEKSSYKDVPFPSTVPYSPDSPETPGLHADGSPVEEHHGQANAPVLRWVRRAPSGFLAYFGCGWADGTPGTILPYLERDFGLSYLTVSLLFVASAVGFAIGTVINEPLVIYMGRFSISDSRRRYLPYLPIGKGADFFHDRNAGHSLVQGRFWVLLLAGVLQLLYFSIAASKPHFYGMLIAFCFGGVAISLFTGQLNAYVSSVPNAGRALGMLHGFYGIGACAAPLVCQTLIAHGLPWSTFYWTSFGIAVCNCCMIIFAFHTAPIEFEQDRHKAMEVLRVMDERNSEDDNAETGQDIPLENLGATPRRPALRRARSGNIPESTMKQTLREPFVWIFAIFLCLYTGSETTVGGWTVSFLLSERHANPKTVGYVATGYWGGLAFGRLFFGQLSPSIGIRIEKHLVHLFIVVALVLEILVWLVPSFVANSICVAFVGFVLGPLFPISLSLATRLFPKHIHMTAMATMSSCASIGSALWPFITGVIANSKGVRAVPPVVLGLLTGMVGLWFLFPSRFRVVP